LRRTGFANDRLPIPSFVGPRCRLAPPPRSDRARTSARGPPLSSSRPAG
jgi:hypothetical protein